MVGLGKRMVNPGYQSIAKDLKQSTKQRFASLVFDHPALDVDGEVTHSVNVYADGPGEAAGCGERGDGVVFYVDGQWMGPVASWDDSRLWELALSPGEEQRVYLAAVLKER